MPLGAVHILRKQKISDLKFGFPLPRSRWHLLSKKLANCNQINAIPFDLNFFAFDSYCCPCCCCWSCFSFVLIFVKLFSGDTHFLAFDVLFLFFAPYLPIWLVQHHHQLMLHLKMFEFLTCLSIAFAFHMFHVSCIWCTPLHLMHLAFDVFHCLNGSFSKSSWFLCCFLLAEVIVIEH